MITRIIQLVDELRGNRPRSPTGREHPSSQQDDTFGIIKAFFGKSCEFEEDCAYPGLGWRCGHRRKR